MPCSHCRQRHAAAVDDIARHVTLAAFHIFFRRDATLIFFAIARCLRHTFYLPHTHAAYLRYIMLIADIY